jgi:hypothetical protein
VLRADPDADLEGALADWRTYRRRKRVADIHWIDAFYHAYLTGIVCVVVVVAASGAVGDGDVGPKGVHDVLVHGTPWLGGIAALAIALGLRSGSRGGPLALERADVRHVLLSPVDRTTALRGPALRQLRFLSFVGTMAGAVAGELAAHRLPGSTLEWVAVGALGGVTAVALSIGSALLAAGLRLPRWFASLAGLVLLGSAGLAGADVVHVSITEPYGRLLLWPLEFHALGLLPPVAAVLLVLVGLAVVGATSLEAAERRSTLVGQLRFAATLQDLRTVVLLRRQLALELPRRRPWIRLRVHGSGRIPIVVRGFRGVFRWPAARMARLVLLAVVAGAALRGVWTGTTPLIVVAGLAMFIAGLDGIEPLAQEVDHPTRRDASPFEQGFIHLRHVPVSVVVMAVTAGIAAAVAAAPGSGHVPGDIAAVLVVPLALGGASGALVSVLGGPASMSETWSIAPPEAQGMRLAFRTAWPPGLAILGTVPILVARAAVRDGNPGPAAAAAAAGGVVTLFILVCGWVRLRERMAQWWKGQMEGAFPTTNRSETDA